MEQIWEDLNPIIVLNVSFFSETEGELKQACISKFNTEKENWVNFLTIKDCEKWDYISVIKVSALFRDMLVNQNEDFYYLIVSSF